MIEYTVKVTALRTRDEGDYTGVVRIVDYRVIGVSGDISFFIDAQSRVAEPQDGQFTPLEDLTEQQVIGWLENSDPTTLEGVKANIGYYIARKQAEAALQMVTPPWFPPPGPAVP